MLNKVIIQGRLTADPELKQTPSGLTVCSFTIACDKSTKGEKACDFIDCNAWRNTAEFVNKYFGKGDMLLAEGRITTNTYVDKATGKNRKSWVITVDSVNFCGGKASAEPKSNTDGWATVDTANADLPF